MTDTKKKVEELSKQKERQVAVLTKAVEVAIGNGFDLQKFLKSHLVLASHELLLLKNMSVVYVCRIILTYDLKMLLLTNHRFVMALLPGQYVRCSVCHRATVVVWKNGNGNMPHSTCCSAMAFTGNWRDLLTDLVLAKKPFEILETYLIASGKLEVEDGKA